MPTSSERKQSRAILSVACSVLVVFAICGSGCLSQNPRGSNPRDLTILEMKDWCEMILGLERDELLKCDDFDGVVELLERSGRADQAHISKRRIDQWGRPLKFIIEMPTLAIISAGSDGVFSSSGGDDLRLDMDFNADRPKIEWIAKP